VFIQRNAKNRQLATVIQEGAKYFNR